MSDLNFSLVSWCERKELISVDVLDVAASSGISTSDLRHDLLERGIQARVAATDILMFGKILRFAPGCYALVDQENNVLQHDFFGVAIRPYYSHKPSADFVTLCANLAHRLLAYVTGPVLVENVKFVSPSAQNIQFVHDNLFKNNADLNSCFDVVRAANILNHGYFEKDRIRAAVRNLTRRLKGGGSLFIVNRTLEDGTNHGSFFELSDEGTYQVVSRIVTGSEIEEIVLSLPLIHGHSRK
jgi:hypothetical protein